jgi:hypothetical protein
MRTILLALLSVLAFGAVMAATAEAATEGPFFKVAGKRLEAGLTQEIQVDAKEPTETRFVTEFGDITVKCSSEKFAPGAKIVGTASGTPEYSEVTITYSGCTVTGDGTSCDVTELKTVPLTGTLAYSAAGRTGDIVVVYTPTGKKRTSRFATVTLSGSGCTIKGEEQFTGSSVGYAKSAYSKIPVGKEPAEGALTQVGFADGPNKAWEEATPLEELELFFSGTYTYMQSEAMNIELVSKGQWGVFT